MGTWEIGVLAGGLALLLIILLAILPFGVWFRAVVSGERISMGKLVGMKMRKLNFRLIVDCYIAARKTGLNVTIDMLETHIMAGGNIKDVVNALISAKYSNIELTTDVARTIDLKGRNSFSLIKDRVKPMIIEIPEVFAFSRDNIKLSFNLKVEFKTKAITLDILELEERFIDRVRISVFDNIGSFNYRDLIRDSKIIGENVLKEKLDSGTVFEILAVDILEIKTVD